MASAAPQQKTFGGTAQQPRLLRRFALYAGLALLIGAVAAFFFVRHYAVAHAEQTAVGQTQLIAASILPGELRPSDFARPVRGHRLAELDRFARRHLLRADARRVKLYAPSGVVVYSTDHQLIGTRPDDFAEMPEIMDGSPVSDVTTLDAEGGNGPDSRVLETYVPISLGNRGPVGVFEMYDAYGPIASDARSIFVPLAIGTAALLLGLYLSLFPILKRVTRTLRKQMEEIEYRANYDSLTGLPNRSFFNDRAEAALAAAKRDGTRFALLLVDLDRFKDVNDTLGHSSGDRLLKAIAEDLPAQMRRSDTVARLGGDEFGVLAVNISDPTAILALAEKLKEVSGRPRSIDGLELEVDASIGIALYPEHGDDVPALIRCADVAMYRSKELHAPALYDSDYDYHSPFRLRLISELNRAIADEELDVLYQPQYDPASRKLHGVEALVRWHHPERGKISPDEFVPLAEHTGQIRELTAYVLNRSLEQLRAWRDEGIAVSVAVNISARDLLDPRFPGEVETALERTGVPPEKLELEITENSAITDIPRARIVLTRLHGLGVKIAVDDFGTGNASLGYLRRLPIDALKIDQSFVRRMLECDEDAAIVQSTISLAHDLGLDVVAEGVEDASCSRRLAELGCDVVQGYHFGEAVPPNRIADLFTAERARQAAL